MPFGFKTMNNIQIYGDGEGNVVIEEWENDEYDGKPVGVVTMSIDRFEFFASKVHELSSEAWTGVKDEQ